MHTHPSTRKTDFCVFSHVRAVSPELVQDRTAYRITVFSGANDGRMIKCGYLNSAYSPRRLQAWIPSDFGIEQPEDGDLVLEVRYVGESSWVKIQGLVLV